jgi:aminomethyltransferase
MKKLVERPITSLRYYRFAENAYRHQRVLVSRTGYTGEIGFEIYFEDGAFARAFWKDAMALGAVPAGLGARDTLRLEMGMPLHGHELGPDRNAADSGFTWAIAANKDFVGAAAVRAGGPARLVGIAIRGRRAARQGDTIKAGAGAEIGTVTSGSFAPSLGHAIAMGYVRKDAAAVGTKLCIQTARQELPGVIVAMPFYKDGTARRPMATFL